MFKFVSSIGNAAYKTAAKTGLAAGSEMPPYPCALPLQVIDDGEDTYQIEAILDATFDAVLDLTVGNMVKLNAVIPDEARRKGWKPVDFTDSEGDLVLSTRHHVGPYNFAKATVTLDGVPPTLILREMHAQSLEARKRFSSSLSAYTVIHRNPMMPAAFIGNDDEHLVELQERGIRDWYIEYNAYYAPPPVAGRDFTHLVEKRYVPETDQYYVYGTTVDFPSGDMRTPGHIRGAVLFAWEFHTTPEGLTKATYVSAMNPNGWAPTFLIGWMKTEIAKEIQHSRRLLYEIIGKNTQAAAQKIRAVTQKSNATSSAAKKSRQADVGRNQKGGMLNEPLAVVIGDEDDGCIMQTEDRRLCEDEDELFLE